MKKYLLFATCAAFLGLAACNKTEENSTSIKSVTISPSELSLGTGGTASLSVSVEPSTAENTSIAWSSADKSIATVSQKGTVTGVGEGTTTVSATIEGVSGTCTVTVVDNAVSVTGVSLSAETLSLTVGATEVLVATVNPEDATNKSVLWTSSDSAVASVDGGIVTALSSGTATITATTSDGGFTATCEVTVSGSGFTSISFANGNAAAIVVEQGSDMTLNVEFNPITVANKNLSWTSSDETIATVTSAGEGKGTVKFTSSKYGAVTITATAEEGGVSASQNFFVKGTQPLYTLPSGKTAVDQKKTYTFNTSYYSTAANVVWTVGEKTYQGAEASFSVPNVGDNEVYVSAQFGDVTISDSFTVSAEEFLVYTDLPDNEWSKNTRPVFNRASTRAYVLTLGKRTVQEINLETGELGWSFSIDDGAADNGPDISVNPITGDIYACNQTQVFAITAEGTQKWVFDASGYKSKFLFKGTPPIVSNDGSIIAVSLESHLVTLNAADGTRLDDYTTKGRAQMAFYGDNKIVLHTHSESSGQIRFLSVSSDGKITEVTRIDNTAAQPAPLSDVTTCAINNDQSKAYFCLNGSSGMTVAVDLKNYALDDYRASAGDHWSPCFAPNGFIYEGIKNNESKHTELWLLDPDNLSEGGTLCWHYDTAADNLNHQGVSCDSEGNVYWLLRDNGKFVDESVYYYFYKGVFDGSKVSDVVALSKIPVSETPVSAFQGCFNSGNGYLVACIGGNGSSSPGKVVVRCFDGVRAKTWSGQGGDICESGNANFAQGIY